MKLSKLVERANLVLSRVREGEEEPEVVVSTQGMSGSRVGVRSAGAGFDWYSGLFVLSAEIPVSTVDISLHSFYRTEYLYQISNLKDVESGKTLTARYKKETMGFEKKFQCALWISKKLKEEKETKC